MFFTSQKILWGPSAFSLAQWVTTIEDKWIRGKYHQSQDLSIIIGQFERDDQDDYCSILPHAPSLPLSFIMCKLF